MNKEPPINQLDALKAQIFKHEPGKCSAEGMSERRWNDLYDDWCAVSNRIDEWRMYIEVLCRIANVRIEKLDEILSIAKAHDEFAKYLRQTPDHEDRG